MAFEGLTAKLSAAFKKLRGKGRLSESDIKEAMREVRMALLEADVNYLVVKDFVKKVTERCVGAEILANLNAGQQVIKIVNEELTALMDSEEVRKNGWISDENQRKQTYRELIGSGDRGALVAMVCALHIHKKEQEQQGKKFHLCDENFLRDAEKLLSTEFSLVLDIEQEQVGSYVLSAINER